MLQEIKNGKKGRTDSKMILRLPSIQVIVAALNEEEGIGSTISDLNFHLYAPHITVVDGKSTDKTAQIAKKLGAEILEQNELGKGRAIAKAIAEIDPKSDYVIIIDADYTYPAEYIPDMIRILEENPEVGMVCGNRMNGNIDKKALREVFYIGNRIISFAHSLINGINLLDPLTGLRVIRTKIIRNWKVQSKGFEVEVELNNYVNRKGYTIAEIPIHYRQRLGEKKLKVSHGAAIVKRILVEFFSG